MFSDKMNLIFKKEWKKSIEPTKEAKKLIYVQSTMERRLEATLKSEYLNSKNQWEAHTGHRQNTYI